METDICHASDTVVVKAVPCFYQQNRIDTNNHRSNDEVNGDENDD